MLLGLTYDLLDHYLDQPDYGWITKWEDWYQSRLAGGVEYLKQAKASPAQSGPSLALAGYAGRYRDPWYGDVTITDEGGKLVMRFTRSPQLVGDLEHWQYDSFLVKWRDRELRADAFVTFSLTPQGGIEQARMEPASSSVDFSYDFQDLVLKPVAK